MSKIDGLYENYQRQADSGIASIYASYQLIKREGKLFVLLNTKGDLIQTMDNVAELRSAVCDDILEHCPASCDGDTFIHMTVDHLLSYYNDKCDFIDVTKGELDMYKSLINLYENIKEFR